LTALCGHGHFDLAAYDAFLNGNMVDSVLNDKDFEAALAALPVM
jgi:tryptophan synthase beta chain